MTLFADFAVTLLVIAMTSYTCRSCQFPVYVQSSAAEAARRRDWRARSRSSRVAATPVRVVVDGGTLSWNALEHEGDARPMSVDRCLEEIKQVSGSYHSVNKKLNCRREAARCFLSVTSYLQLYNTPSTVIYLLLVILRLPITAYN